MSESRSCSRRLRAATGQASVAGRNRCLYRRRGLGGGGGGVSSAIRREHDQICFGWQECGTKEKRPSGASRRALARKVQNGASPDSAPGSALEAGGASASARLSLRTEFARTLQKTLN